MPVVWNKSFATKIINYKKSYHYQPATNYFGHEKFSIGRCGQPACIWGAIAWGNNERWVDDESPVITAINDYLGNDAEHPSLALGNVIIWNNAEERTQEEVVDVLRNVAIKYRDDAMTVAGDVV